MALKQSNLLAQRLSLFPYSAQIEKQGHTSRLTVSGVSLLDLAQQYGTPLYVYDRTTLQAGLQRYEQSLAEAYPAPSGIT